MHLAFLQEWGASEELAIIGSCLPHPRQYIEQMVCNLLWRDVDWRPTSVQEVDQFF